MSTAGGQRGPRDKAGGRHLSSRAPPGRVGGATGTLTLGLRALTSGHSQFRGIMRLGKECISLLMSG
eukprot:760213-Prorocentrum_minimum.AAC.1